MMLCLQLGTAQKWFCVTVNASIYQKSMLVPVLLDVINIRDSCPKSSQKIWPEPSLAEFAKRAGPAGAGAEIQYIRSKQSNFCSY